MRETTDDPVLGKLVCDGFDYEGKVTFRDRVVRFTLSVHDEDRLEHRREPGAPARAGPGGAGGPRGGGTGQRVRVQRQRGRGGGLGERRVAAELRGVRAPSVARRRRGGL